MSRVGPPRSRAAGRRAATDRCVNGEIIASSEGYKSKGAGPAAAAMLGTLLDQLCSAWVPGRGGRLALVRVMATKTANYAPPTPAPG